VKLSAFGVLSIAITLNLAGLAVGVAAEPRTPRVKNPAGGQERISTPTTNKESAALRLQARTAMRAGKMDEVERILDAARKTRLRTEREAWQVFEAEFRCAKKEYQNSALIAMRLVTLSPKSPHVGEALYWAARAYEGLRRPGKAAELYRECIEHKSSDENTIRQARAALKPLTTQMADPSRREAP
jgi:tetratricopeptide (TPR) repeat protein